MKLQNERLEDVAERVRQNHRAALAELQARPEVRVIADVQLANGADVPIRHGLGRAPLWVRESTPRGAATSGRVEEIRGGIYDRAQVVVLRATGFGATITVDVAVI